MQTKDSIKERTLPYMKAPCANCPYRKDSLEGWLGHRIEDDLKSPSFVCHKTTKGRKEDRRQCAGHMILKGVSNQFVRTAKTLQIDLGLKGQALVFDSVDDCIAHHKK